MKELLALIITLGIIGIIGVITWGFCKISDLIYDKKIQKSKEKFPDFYELVGYRYELSTQICDLIRKRLEIKDKITRTLADLPYLTPNKQAQAESQLVQWREELEDIEENQINLLRKDRDKMDERIQALKEEIESNGGKVY